jgi:hypothetical protein
MQADNGLPHPRLHHYHYYYQRKKKRQQLLQYSSARIEDTCVSLQEPHSQAKLSADSGAYQSNLAPTLRELHYGR